MGQPQGSYGLKTRKDGIFGLIPCQNTEFRIAVHGRSRVHESRAVTSTPELPQDVHQEVEVVDKGSKRLETVVGSPSWPFLLTPIHCLSHLATYSSLQ